MERLLRFILPVIVLVIGYLGYQKLSKTEEEPKPMRPRPQTVEAEASVLKRIDYRVKLESQGIVHPHNQTSLTPRVSGRVIKISPKFESGSFFNANDILLELDPTDFLTAKISAEARLARAEASLAQEEARAEQALLDWKDLGYETEPTDLVLRKPQLKEALANVKAASADLSEAERAFDRTKVLAPYSGRVKERLVGLGQSVSPGTTLGDIYSTDFAEVRLSLSARELTHVKLPHNPDDPPVPITLTDALTETSTQSWNGFIVRTEGTLDEDSRKLFVIARVDDPFGLKSNVEAPLRIGQPVRGTLEGSLIPNVFVIPRANLRRPNEILTINPEDLTLKRQTISSIWSDRENLIVTDDLIEGWHIVTNRIATVANGAKVKIVEPREEEETKAASTNEGKPRA